MVIVLETVLEHGLYVMQLVKEHGLKLLLNMLVVTLVPLSLIVIPVMIVVLGTVLVHG
jgi:hypothetical protein